MLPFMYPYAFPLSLQDGFPFNLSVPGDARQWHWGTIVYAAIPRNPAGPAGA